MDVREAIYSRRAVRSFTDETVEPTTISKLIDAAIQAPSAMNGQPWAFTVIRNRHVLDRISCESKQYTIENAPATISPLRMHDVITDPHYDIFYHAPVLIVVSSRPDNQWNVENCALAAGNMMLAAHGLGLGTCWIGLAEFWLRTSEGKAFLEIPASYIPVAPIIVGHPKERPLPVPRKTPEVNWVNS